MVTGSVIQSTTMKKRAVVGVDSNKYIRKRNDL